MSGKHHTYSSTAVVVDGGALTVGIWEPRDAQTDTIIAVHGVTASHRAWANVVDALPGVRVIAPDLRGRGRSNTVAGLAGMATHAHDIVAMMDSLGIDSAVVVGHSMGAFVAVVAGYLRPDRVQRLVLIDGGLPLDVPAGLSSDAVVKAVLGPTAERLNMRFANNEEYFDFWRKHPAFVGEWTAELEDYLAYDLVPDEEGALRPATSYAAMATDTLDLNTGDLPKRAIEKVAVPALFVWVPRGLQNETPGLYAPAHRDELKKSLEHIRFTELDDLNHYTVVMSERGAAALAPIIMAELAAAAEAPAY